jgi:ADP-ribose pyrophosphatase YjhB (NUDIX family)
MAKSSKLVAVKRGRILLVRRRRDRLWMFPGSQKRERESAKDCLRREIKEELPKLKLGRIKLWKEVNGMNRHSGRKMSDAIFIVNKVWRQTRDRQGYLAKASRYPTYAHVALHQGQALPQAIVPPRLNGLALYRQGCQMRDRRKILRAVAAFTSAAAEQPEPAVPPSPSALPSASKPIPAVGALPSAPKPIPAVEFRRRGFLRLFAHIEHSRSSADAAFTFAGVPGGLKCCLVRYDTVHASVSVQGPCG